MKRIFTNQYKEDVSLSEIHSTVDPQKRKGWRRIFAYMGPAYLVSVGYMDPGNWATDLQGGSKFGYTLIWVLLMSNIMALLLQGLSARLGVVRGRDLAQANREEYPRFLNFILWILAEVAIAACDLAEVLGMAIGLQLLTGIPLIWGVAITVLDTFVLLLLQRAGMRAMEAFIISLVSIITIAFLIQIFLASPELSDIAGGLIPSLPSDEALYIAIGIIGATVMPHNLYLHSALVQTRKLEKTDKGIRRAIRFNRVDTTIALNIAFIVNASILIVAAAVFYKSGLSNVDSIEYAHRLLPDFLGAAAPVLFAVALIAAGQSSTVTSTLAGQIVMEGYLRIRITPWLRRLITRLIAIIPAVLVIAISGEDEVDNLLILSQVILSLQLGFAVIPLIHFVSDKTKMGKFAIPMYTRLAAWIIALVLVYLNGRMLVNEATPVFAGDNILAKSALTLAGLFFAGLLFYIALEPILSKRKKEASIKIHPEMEAIHIQKPVYNTIAMALDFSGNDSRIINAALGQGSEQTQYLLIHVVESASARFQGRQSYDYETRKDQAQLDKYVEQLGHNGYAAEGALGFRKPAREIVRLVKENNVDLLVVGTHGHRAIKDAIFGQTVNTVRHRLDIPVLMVSLKES